MGEQTAAVNSPPDCSRSEQFLIDQYCRLPSASQSGSLIFLRISALLYDHNASCTSAAIKPMRITFVMSVPKDFLLF